MNNIHEQFSTQSCPSSPATPAESTLSIRDLVGFVNELPDELGLEHGQEADDARALAPLQVISPRAFAATLELVERYRVRSIDTASLAEAVEAQDALRPLADAASRLSRRLEATLRVRRAVAGRQVLKAYGLLKAQLRYDPDTWLSDELESLRELIGVQTGSRSVKEEVVTPPPAPPVLPVGGVK